MKACLLLTTITLLLVPAPGRAASEVHFLDGNGTWQQVKTTAFAGAQKSATATLGKGLTFNVVFEDVEAASGFGFDDASLGQTRRDTFFAVLDYLAAIIGDRGSVDILVGASLNDTLAAPSSGGPLFLTSAGLKGFYKGFAQEHITTLADPCRTDNCGENLPDMQITINFGRSFNSGMGDPTSTQFDLFSEVLHQLTHGLGALTLMLANGIGALPENTNIYTFWDSLLITGGDRELFDANGKFIGTRPLLAGVDGGVFWRGPRITAALGSRPRMYSPDPFLPGRSLSHWSDVTSAEAVLAPIPTTGVARRTYAAFELEMLADLGYKVNVPQKLLFTWISNSSDFESTLVVNNYGQYSATFSLTGQRANGTNETVGPFTVGPRSLFKQKAGSLFAGLGVGPGYTVLLTSDSPTLEGRWVTNDLSADAPSQGVAVSLVKENIRLGQVIDLGFLPGDERFQSAPVLTNVGDEPTDLTIYYFSTDGSLQDTQIFEDIQPFLPQLGTIGNQGTGDRYAVAVAKSQQITGVVFVFNAENQTAIGNVTAIEGFLPPQ